MDAGLVTILQKAGVENETREYLIAKKIRTVPVLAFLAENEIELNDRLINQFVTGVTIGDTEYKSTDDPDVTRAGLIALWTYCRREVHVVPAPASMGMQAAVGPVASATSSKPPTCLANGIWAPQIAKYENANAGRKFPSILLVGAEGVLARVLFEIQTSKLFTPIRLGEIISCRSFTVVGKVNPLAIKVNDKMLGLEGDKLVEKKAPDFDPRGQWSMTVCKQLCGASCFAKWPPNRKPPYGWSFSTG